MEHGADRAAGWAEGWRVVMSYRIGIDIGGTFTDIVLLGSDGRVETMKVSSSVDDYSRAIAAGLSESLAQTGILAANIEEVRHGTTVGSNAILEHKGARTGLIGTKGFRDILQIRNLRLPRLYDIAWDKPRPLVDRHLRMTVEERVRVDGSVEIALDPVDAERAVSSLLAEGVEAIAVCLLHAYANDSHERMIGAIVERLCPGLPCCLSHQVLPEIGEYERTSTTVINTYVLPVIKAYLGGMRRELGAIGIRAPLRLMQSNGGLTSSELAERFPMNIVESGPAAGVVGARNVAARIGLRNVITFDMGGTTAKASLLENGEFSRSLEYQIGGGIINGSRLLTGSGYLLKVPAIDLAEVGAGGGSIIAIDEGGLLQVGPHSAASNPGPVCYDLGGTQPTVTDAVLTLGYLNPDYLVNGAVRLDGAKARGVIEECIARPLGLSLERAAYGAYQIAVSRMMRAIRAVSTERGRDPREFTLFAFGGNGPVFAATMAQALRIKKVVVPPLPGVFSALGLLFGDIEHHYARTFRCSLRSVDHQQLEQAWSEAAAQACERLVGDGTPQSRIRVRRSATLRYQGQTFELTVAVLEGPLNAPAIAAMEEAFGAEHERTYGHRASAEEPVELVTIQVVAQSLLERPGVPEHLTFGGPERNATRPKPRQAYFGPAIGWRETPVLWREDLSIPRNGPCIIEEYSATCVVPPDASASLDGQGNIIINIGE